MLSKAALSGLHTANLSWQTRVGKLRKLDKLFPSHGKLVSNNKHGNLQQGRFSSVVALTNNSEAEEKKRRNRKFADCFCAFHTYQLEFANTSLPTLVCRVKAALKSTKMARASS